MVLVTPITLAHPSHNWAVRSFFVWRTLARCSRMRVGADGLGQMQHFVKDDGYNLFRLPVGWQYLTYNQMTGVLNETQFANYNMLVNACLDTGAYCIIDIHNYARYNGEVRPVLVIGFLV